jgi:hypothetical protein
MSDRTSHKRRRRADNSPLQRLPDDVFRHLCSYLPPLQGPCALARVNRDWCRVVKTLPAVAALHTLYTLDSDESDAIIAAHNNRRLCAVATQALADVNTITPTWFSDLKCSQNLIARYMALMESIEVRSVEHTGEEAGNATLWVNNRRTFLLKWWSSIESKWSKLYKQQSFILSTPNKQLVVRVTDTRAGEYDDGALFKVNELTKWLEQHAILLPTDSKRVVKLFQESLLDDLFAAVVQEDAGWRSLLDEDNEDEDDEDDDEDDEDEA